MKKLYLFLFSAVILIIIAVSWVTAIFRFSLEKTKIKIKDKQFVIWIAKTQKARLQGLQNIIWMPKNRGMLFAFDKQDTYCFWNKNTLIPLSLIFMREGKIINEVYLKPAWQGRQTVCPNEPIDAVLEINAK